MVKPLSRQDYEPTWRSMQRFTDARDEQTADEIWLVEHPPIFTLGLAGKSEHLLATGEIPVIKTERGGQVTYHGPGQVVAYTMIDLRRAGLSIKRMVCLLEDALIATLAEFSVQAERQTGAPGVYIAPPSTLAGSKIGALGLKVRRGCSYHGVALNVAMDLSPFARINPCGYPGLAVTDIASAQPQSAMQEADVTSVATVLGRQLAQCLAQDHNVTLEKPAQ
ncbi:MAG: lipoyl(octanoyl) transferase LipB [Burkholderiaceae bacterium]